MLPLNGADIDYLMLVTRQLVRKYREGNSLTDTFSPLDKEMYNLLLGEQILSFKSRAFL